MDTDNLDRERLLKYLDERPMEEFLTALQEFSKENGESSTCMRLMFGNRRELKLLRGLGAGTFGWTHACRIFGWTHASCLLLRALGLLSFLIGLKTCGVYWTRMMGWWWRGEFGRI